MLAPPIRWLLVVLFVVFGAHALAAGRPAGCLAIVSALVLAAGYFLYGSVHTAFVALRRGDLARAHGLITQTAPRWLTPKTRAYYHWVRAALAEARGQMPEAIDELEQALARPLRSDRERILALGTLAALRAKTGERDAALEALDEAERLGPSGEVTRLLSRIRDDLHSAGRPVDPSASLGEGAGKNCEDEP